MSVDNRISLHKLEVFMLVVELGGVGKAAESLHVAQPVVTAHIRSLEERVGVKLFIRDGRRLSLTPAGEAVRIWALDLLTHTQEFSRHLEGLVDGTRGSASIAASMSVGSYLLPPLVSDFSLKNPNISISLNIFHSDQAIRAIETGECDFAVLLAESPPAAPGLVGKRLGAEPLMLVGPPQGPPAGPEISLDELADLNFVELPEGFLRRNLNEAHMVKAGLQRRNIVIQMGHPEAMKRAVERGLGVALLFRNSVETELAMGTLRELRVQGWEVSVPIHLVHRKDRQFSGAQQTVIDALSKAIANRP
jgi:DNA-binding transcriptional LysR family regulator